MTPLMVFAVILAVAFIVLMVALRPSASEKAVAHRLRTIERVSTGGLPEEVADLLRREKLSDIPWINELMQQVPIFHRLHSLLVQAESSWTAGMLISLSVVCLVVGTWILNFWAPSFFLALLGGVALGSSPFIFLLVKRWKRLKRFEELLPDTIDLMARALRAGYTITSSIEMVASEGNAPASSEFRRVFEEQNFGLPLREALLNLASRVPLEDVSFMVTAILVQKETGGNLAEVLDKTSAVIRERFRLRGQLKVYTAQGRLTGWILAAMPFVMFVLLNLVNPGYEQVLFKDPVGRKLIYAGIVLLVTGGWVIRKVIDVKV